MKQRKTTVGQRLYSDFKKEPKMKIIYSSENKIFCFDDENKSLTEIPCGKIIKYRETVRSIRQRKEWKTSGSGAEFMGMYSADNIDPDILFTR